MNLKPVSGMFYSCPKGRFFVMSQAGDQVTIKYESNEISIIGMSEFIHCTPLDSGFSLCKTIAGVHEVLERFGISSCEDPFVNFSEANRLLNLEEENSKKLRERELRNKIIEYEAIRCRKFAARKRAVSLIPLEVNEEYFHFEAAPPKVIISDETLCEARHLLAKLRDVSRVVGLLFVLGFPAVLFVIAKILQNDSIKIMDLLQFEFSLLVMTSIVFIPYICYLWALKKVFYYGQESPRFKWATCVMQKRMEHQEIWITFIQRQMSLYGEWNQNSWKKTNDYCRAVADYLGVDDVSIIEKSVIAKYLERNQTVFKSKPVWQQMILGGWGTINTFFLLKREIKLFEPIPPPFSPSSRKDAAIVASQYIGPILNFDLPDLTLRSFPANKS